MSLAPFDIDLVPESEELLKTAEEQLGETPEVREEAFKELRQLLRDNGDLRFDEDEETLRVFLRARRWCPENAIKLVSPGYHPQIKIPKTDESSF
jgi:hypothetical protein